MEQPPKKSRSQRKLIELNDELENYFSNTIIPQLFVDADMILRKFTPPAMKHFNLSAEDVGRHIDDVSSNIRFPTIIENIEEVIESSKDLEKEIQTTDKRWYQLNILPYIVRKENRTNGVIITFIDINDRIDMLRRYEKLNKRYENIIFSMSHDIKGPLSNIEGLVDALRDMQGEEADTKPVMDMLSQSVRNLRSTVVELSDIGESDTDFAKVPERVNFGNMIEDAKLALKDKIYEAGAQIKAEINVPEIILSRKNVRSIVYNLLSNAVKYRAPDRAPDIFIKTEASGDFILLSVSDNGVGIEDDKKEAIFERHTRLRKDVEGTGMGLFIVKRLAEDTGGKVEVESKLGEGTTFHVCLKGQR
ncbi:ATP-binding protein [Pontibacter diazotrophicus]|uniref:histidine kinase n=1 Tax=Pontibacter diazotrophicus TaxID=1400979 RepID=A0A3D8L280_9BACT|nr:ATP-binding protein [Pontibacter diazotrophicus]RDV11453.1 ATP-binding protein [Pontibacter diazotrophicus]